MRIFLDANILFSAAKSDGAVREFLGLLQKAGHELCVDGYVVEEARRNLSAKAPASLPVMEDLLGRMHHESMVRTGAELAQEVRLPEKDRPVLAAAIHAGCGALVTGDTRHFGSLYGRRIGGVAIHSPRSLALSLL